MDRLFLIVSLERKGYNNVSRLNISDLKDITELEKLSTEAVRERLNDVSTRTKHELVQQYIFETLERRKAKRLETRYVEGRRGRQVQVDIKEVQIVEQPEEREVIDDEAVVVRPVVNDIWRRRLRNKRVVKESMGVIYQNTYDEQTLLGFTLRKLEQVKRLNEVNDLRNHYGELMGDIFGELINGGYERSECIVKFKIVVEDSRTMPVSLKYMHVSLSDIVRMTESTVGSISNISVIRSYDKLKEAIKTALYDMVKFVLIGFQILILRRGEQDFSRSFERIRAFNPSSCNGYHKLTKCSTTDNKMCIYETYAYLYMNISNIKSNKKLINERFENESDDVKRYVINGELYNFMAEKAKVHGDMYVEFYKKSEGMNFVRVKQDGKCEFIDEIEKNSRIFFYYEGHVAPRIHEQKDEKKVTDNKTKSSVYRLSKRPKSKYDYIKEKDTLLSFKLEYENTQSGDVYVKMVNIYDGKENVKICGDSTDDVLSNFYNYIDDKYVIKTYTNKTQKTGRVKNIMMYGYGNSRMDNYSIVLGLIKRNPSTKLRYNSGSIAMIRYYNIRIFDLSTYYQSLNINGCQDIYRVSEEHLKICSGQICKKTFDISFAHNVSSSCLKMYNQVFQKYTLTSSPDEVYEIERSIYKGGLCIAGKIGEFNQEMSVYDINSSFSSVMRNNKMPAKYLRTWRNLNSKYEYDDYVNYNIYKIKTMRDNGDNTSKDYMRVVMKRDELNDVYLWGISIKSALECGCIVGNVMEVIEYEGDILFDEYVDHFYSRKENSTRGSTEYLYNKGMLNNLYGKFAQKSKITSKICKNADEITWIANKHKVVDFDKIGEDGEYIDVKYIDEGQNRYNVGRLARISSYITAHARYNLLDGVQKIGGFEHLYYADTDSMITDNKLPDNMIDDKKLGKWKLEKTINKLVILGKKNYSYIDVNNNATIHCSGIKKDNVTYNDFVVANDKGEQMINNDQTFKTKDGKIKIVNKNIRLRKSVT